MMNGRRYQLRSSVLAEMKTSWDWITDEQIDFLLQLKDGVVISLNDAAAMYYDAAIRPDLTLDHKILDIGLVRYVTEVLQLRIDIFPEILEFTSDAA